MAIPDSVLRRISASEPAKTKRVTITELKSDMRKLDNAFEYAMNTCKILGLELTREQLKSIQQTVREIDYVRDDEITNAR